MSKFALHDSINQRADKKNKALDKLAIFDKFDYGIVNNNDLYIVYAIHVLTFSTTYQTIEYLKWWKEKYELQISDSSESIIERLGELQQSSMVRRYRFKLKDGQNMDYFYVTPAGYNFLKKRLYFDGPYDEYLGAVHFDDVLKQLSVNDVALKNLNHLELDDYHILKKPVFSSHVQKFFKTSEKKKNIHLYGFFQKESIIIEPFSVSEKTSFLFEVEKERMIFFKKYLAENSSLKVVFLLDEIDSIKRIAAYLKQMPNEHPNIYVATESDALKNKYVSPRISGEQFTFIETESPFSD